MFSNATNWWIAELLHRERLEAAACQAQKAEVETAGTSDGELLGIADDGVDAHVVVIEKRLRHKRCPGAAPSNKLLEHCSVRVSMHILQAPTTSSALRCSCCCPAQTEENGPLASSKGKGEDSHNLQQRSFKAGYQSEPSVIKTHLQLGRQAFRHKAPSIFELSCNSNRLDRLQEALSLHAPTWSSSSSSQLFSPHAFTLELASVHSLTAAAAFSRAVSLRHTPTLARLPAPVQDVLEGCRALFIEDGNLEGLAEAAAHVIAESGISDTFYIYDLGEVVRLYNTWRAAMPRVAPHYAVKCNPEPLLLAMLAALGAGFDCASIMELEAAQALGVSQKRIIFANPCKMPADFRYAVAHGVQTTVFDTPSELHKIAQLNPRFKCVLRIRCDDPTAQCPLGAKYGADMPEVPGLLQLARELHLQVIGVSFHVGSGCRDVSVYDEAIKRARSVFDMAEQQFSFAPLTLLDLGGGFAAPCDESSSKLFRETAGTINAALDAHFPPGCGVDVISEPGRFFAETSAALFTSVLGQRESRDASSDRMMDYWLSDSNQGSFKLQVVHYDSEPSCLVLRNPLLPDIALPSSEQAEPQEAGAHTKGTNGSRSGDFETLHSSRLIGTSGRDNDKICAHAQLPLLRDGDWLMFPFAGAYTISSASNYSKGAFLHPARLIVFSSQADKGWGDVLPQAAVFSTPHTIPERDLLEQEADVHVVIYGLAPLAPLRLLQQLGLDWEHSGSLQLGRSMQRLLRKAPFMPRERAQQSPSGAGCLGA